MGALLVFFCAGLAVIHAQCTSTAISLSKLGDVCDGQTKFCDPREVRKAAILDGTAGWQKLKKIVYGESICVQGACHTRYSIDDGKDCVDDDNCKSQLCTNGKCAASPSVVEPHQIGDSCETNFCYGNLVCDAGTKKCVQNDGKNNLPADLGEECYTGTGDFPIKPCKDPNAQFCHEQNNKQTCIARVQVGADCVRTGLADNCVKGSTCDFSNDKCKLQPVPKDNQLCDPNVSLLGCDPSTDQRLACSNDMWLPVGSVPHDTDASVPDACQPGLWYDANQLKCVKELTCQQNDDCTFKSVYEVNAYCDCNTKKCKIWDTLTFHCTPTEYQDKQKQLCAAQRKLKEVVDWTPVHKNYNEQRAAFQAANTHLQDEFLSRWTCFFSTTNPVNNVVNQFWDIDNPGPTTVAPTVVAPAPSGTVPPSGAVPPSSAVPPSGTVPPSGAVPPTTHTTPPSTPQPSSPPPPSTPPPSHQQPPSHQTPPTSHQPSSTPTQQTPTPSAPPPTNQPPTSTLPAGSLPAPQTQPPTGHSTPSLSTPSQGSLTPSGTVVQPASSGGHNPSSGTPQQQPATPTTPTAPTTPTSHSSSPPTGQQPSSGAHSPPSPSPSPAAAHNTPSSQHGPPSHSPSSTPNGHSNPTSPGTPHNASPSNGHGNGPSSSTTTPNLSIPPTPNTNTSCVVELQRCLNLFPLPTNGTPQCPLIQAAARCYHVCPAAVTVCDKMVATHAAALNSCDVKCIDESQRKNGIPAAIILAGVGLIFAFLLGGSLVGSFLLKKKKERAKKAADVAAARETPNNASGGGSANNTYSHNVLNLPTAQVFPPLTGDYFSTGGYTGFDSFGNSNSYTYSLEDPYIYPAYTPTLYQ